MIASLFSLPAGLPPDPALFSTLLDLLPMGVMYYTPIVGAGGTLTDLTLAYLNPAAQRMTQLPAQPGTTYRQQFPTTDANGAWDFHRRSWLGQEPGQFRFYYDADGFDNYFRVTAQRLGEGLLTIFTDTQDEDRSEVETALHLKQAREQAARADAEQQAIAVREMMRQLFDQAPVAISLVRGPQLLVEMLNEEAATLLGSTQLELLGKPLLETMPIVREQGLAALFERVLQGEVFVFDELPITFPRAHRGQPDLGYYRVIYQPWRDGATDIIGMVTIAVEVSEQVLARQQVQRLNEELAASNADYQQTNRALGETQQQLRQRNQELEAAQAAAEADRQRLYQVLMRMPANIALLRGPAHIYDLVNVEYERLFPNRRLLGRPLREVIPELDGQGFYELFDRVYKTGEPFYEPEMEAWADYAGTGERQRRYYRTTFEPIRDAQGQVTEVLNFAVDVTGQVEARRQVEHLNQELETRVQARTEELAAVNEALSATNDELQQSNQQLTRTNVDLDTFVYMASHDLKAPITNIESIVLALRDTLPLAVQQDEMSAQLLDLLDQTAARFRFTIAQLTDLSKLQLTHAGPAEPLVLAQVVEAVRLDLAPAIVAADAQLTAEIPPELVVSFSPANLRSIVYNLLSNAVKYRAADRPAQVRLRAWQTPQAVVLTIQDNGLGLNEHQQSRLFGLFQRLHDHVEGTGVGLYITKRLVENGGGTIAVASQPNAGTTFTVTLPT